MNSARSRIGSAEPPLAWRSATAGVGLFVGAGEGRGAIGHGDRAGRGTGLGEALLERIRLVERVGAPNRASGIGDAGIGGRGVERGSLAQRRVVDEVALVRAVRRAGQLAVLVATRRRRIGSRSVLVPGEQALRPVEQAVVAVVVHGEVPTAAVRARGQCTSRADPRHVAQDDRSTARATRYSEHAMDADRGAQPVDGEVPPALDALIDLANALRRRATSAPGEEREARAESLRHHVEDYLIPRAADLDAPLLVVIMGSTGAGKSSLLNALAGGPVSPSGVLRPTTRQPVAIVHPEDAGGRFAQTAERAGLDVRLDAFARRGLAIVDAPDFDSAEGENREAALHLLEVADLVIFVTTATRYADQAPWEVVGRARGRGLAFRAVLNRLPVDDVAADAVVADFRELLERAGANGSADVVTVREGAVDPERDALAHDAVAPLREALDALVASEDERREVARRGLASAMRGVPHAVEAIAREIEEEQKAVADLRTAADTAFEARRRDLDEELGRGVFLRAEVLRQWQDFVGAGQVARFLSDGIGKVVATVRSMFETTARAPAIEVRQAAFADLVALVVQHADTAAQRTASAWSEDRYGALALAGEDGLWRASDALPERLTADLEAWAAGIGEQIRELGARRKGWAQAASLGVNAIGTSAVLAVFVHTGGLTGTEVGITAATAVVNQKLLEAIFGEANVTAFVGRARSDLRELLDRAFVDERARFEGALGSTGDPGLARRLRDAARRVSTTAAAPSRPDAAGPEAAPATDIASA